jgi:hypothetical protein
MITLKAIKYMASHSQETHCYSADLYFNNKKAAVVSNYGHGGCDDAIIVNQAAWDAATEYTKALPERAFLGGTFPQDIESICCELVNDYLERKELKRLLSKRVIYTQTDADGIYQTKAARSAAQRDSWVAQIAARPDTNVVFNSLDFEAALTLFKGQP